MKFVFPNLNGRKFIGLYFCSSSDNNCKKFTPILVKAYDLLKRDGANFEIVTVSLNLDDKQDDDVDSVNNDEGEGSELKMPWLNVPFKDHNSRIRLVRYFKIRLSDLPKLVIIGAYGETLMENAVDAIEEYVAEAFPFKNSTLDELKEKEKEKEKEKARLEALNLENIFTSSKDKFLIGKVSWYNFLTGKHILLHISGKVDTPRVYPLGQFLGMYREIKNRGDSDKIEIVYIPNEADHQTSFYECLQFDMPLMIVPVRENKLWLESIRCLFKVDDVCEGKMVVIGLTGKIITSQGIPLLMSFGGCVYPFTEERLGEMVKEWPKTMNDVSIHEHEVSFVEIVKYNVLCEKDGLLRAFSCQQYKCNFVIHPKCARDKIEQQA